MAILSKLWTLIRGGATEAGQAVVDSNALRILDQEIRDAQNALQRSRDDLTKIMAQQRLAGGKLVDKKGKAAEYEGYIQKALAQGDEKLAREVAEKLAGVETEVAEGQSLVEGLQKNVTTLQVAIRQTETNLQRLKSQVDNVKATESVQRAQSALAAQHSGTNSKMRTALDSLDRVKQRQLERAAQMDAASELANSDGDSDLQKRLAAAGITQGASSADSILARFAKPQAVTDESAAAAPDAITVEFTSKVPRS